MLIPCPKCGADVESSRLECPSCGIVFKKYLATRIVAPAPMVASPPTAEQLSPPAPPPGASMEPPSPSVPPPVPLPADRRGISGIRGRSVCLFAASLILIELAAWLLLLLLSPFTRSQSVPLFTPAVGGTLLLLVLGRILTELERMRDLLELQQARAEHHA